MDKTLNYLSIARKAGLAQLGEEPVGAASRDGKAHLILVAFDATDHTWRRAKSFVAGTRQQCLRVTFSKDELGQATGRQELAIAAITDVNLALSLVQSLEQPERYEEVLSVLTEKSLRLKKRQSEAKAHARNVRKGKK